MSEPGADQVQELLASFAPVAIVVGHYGVGKTNLALNLALDAASRGRRTVLCDLDVVNPYFRSSDYTKLLEKAGVHVVAPVFAGTTLDTPSISGEVATAIEWAQQPADDAAVEGAGAGRRLLVIDAGGDDVGATVLGRFAGSIRQAPYTMLYTVNERRNLTQRPEEAVEVLREIEATSRLAATAIANNTNLKQETDPEVVSAGVAFAKETARLSGLPLAFTAVPRTLMGAGAGRFPADAGEQGYYPVEVYVRTPWE